MKAGVAILGLGASGDAAARLALSKGDDVYVSELRTDSATQERARGLRELGARVELGSHDLARIETAGVVVVSPGIPPDSPVLRHLDEGGWPWITEPEFAARFYQGSLIAITGTNGKTTTAALVAHLLNSGGLRAALGGNVGEELAPAASALALLDPPPEWYVLELSSFQLAGVQELTPDIGMVTSLAPDHLDRYPDLASYYADKKRLFLNANPESLWVLNGGMDAVRALPGQAPGRRCYFALDVSDTLPVREDGRAHPSDRDEPGGPSSVDSGERDPGSTPDAGAFLVGRELTLRLASGREVSVGQVDGLSLLGDHNVMNALAAALTASLAGVSVDSIGKGLASFKPLPHRMEPVLELDGVLWVNDSKATNVEAARSAVESLKRPGVVLLGGKDKGETFGSMVAPLANRARVVVLYGEAAVRLEGELKAEGTFPFTLLRVDGGFERAVSVAADRAQSGDVLLLSPACSSFDEFRDYRARGERFAELAHGRARARSQDSSSKERS